jgi:6-phosphogluconolactonase
MSLPTVFHIRYHALQTVLRLSLTSILCATSVATFAQSCPNGDRLSGAVYAMTNDATDNRILVYSRNSNGLLAFKGSVSTHGRGSGGIIDPLLSQGSLALSHRGRPANLPENAIYPMNLGDEEDEFLFAANAGSGTITSFRVVPFGLAFVAEANSGGAEPISISIHGDLLYVLNNDSITGFRVLQDGTLKPIQSSTRFLAAVAARDLGASDIAFSPNGRFLIVIERVANQIVVFPVNADGTTATAVPSNSNGNTPFSCAFTSTDVLIVAEFAGGPGGDSAASSYLINSDGTLKLVTGSLPTQGTSACWNVVTRDGKFSIVTNSISSTATLFSMSDDGQLSFISVTSAGPNVVPIDTALSANGLFLYILDAGAGAISEFRLDESSQTLALLGTISDGLTGNSGLNGLTAH